MATSMSSAAVAAEAEVGNNENDQLLTPLIDEAEQAETDSSFARRLAQEELDELRQQHQRTEDNDYAIATAVRADSWEAYRNDRRCSEPYYGTNVRYYATNARPVIIHQPDETSHYCFCVMFWCFFFWLLVFLLIIVLVPTYVTEK